MSLPQWKIWVDTGGTFTDCIAVTPSGQLKRLKVLSTSLLRVKVLAAFHNTLTIEVPVECSKNFLNGFTVRSGDDKRKIIHFDYASGSIVLNKAFDKKKSIQTIEITTGEEVPVFAARLLTETGLEEIFPWIEMKLGSTRGTNALLERKGARTAFVVTKGFRDLLLIGNQQRQDLFSLRVLKEDPLYTVCLEVNERIESDGSVLHQLTTADSKRIISILKKRKIDSVAVALMNSYKNPTHENLLEGHLKKGGFRHISLSHKVSQQIKILTRAETTVVNAYLNPIIHKYVSNIQAGLGSSSIQIMSSAGGLLPASHFMAKDSLLSGPAGGVIGALTKARLSGIDQIITFDMGGTSTDVSRCNGRPDYRFECNVGNLKIFSPSLSIETIAAGGGSICQYHENRLTVGPHSAGASPGPACYGSNGPLTITDVNLLLGRLDENSFTIPINPDRSVDALQPILSQLKKKNGEFSKTEVVLQSFIDIANEKMAEAIRKISIQKGHDPKNYSLLCFGGAGGQHACSIAALLGMHQIMIPYDAGLLSAFGIGNAAPERVVEKLILKNLSEILFHLEEEFQHLNEQAVIELKKGVEDVDVITSSRRLVFLRLKGQETSLEIEFTKSDDIKKAFVEQYKIVYGHWIEDREIEVESIRLILTAQELQKEVLTVRHERFIPQPLRLKKIYASGSWKDCPLFRWEGLTAGATIDGPALLVSSNSTVLIENGWRFVLDENENGRMQHLHTYQSVQKKPEEAQLELFTNRFTSIAEDMGTMLQRSSFSVNVKERLDFSCAVLDSEGMLIVNAPHIPVHLGSMGVCVRTVIKKVQIREGDVIITNHPAYGGSHLPDITLIKPVFVKHELVGFVANRAHHAEIGGKSPGSMPADATCLEEEGVIISPTSLVKEGSSRWQQIENILTTATYPTRALQENLADLNGALASLVMGADAIERLCADFGVDQVRFYMKAISRHSSQLMRRKILTLTGPFKASETMDNGAKLKVHISKEKGKLKIDFSGSASVQKGNLNATPAIINSVVLYVLRLLLGQPVPLNEGLLQNIKMILPSGMLNPNFSKDNKKSPAVVGGNTEISQRLTDTLLKAFGLAACSQGTMNNLLFGNERFGYYETICGGVGAIPGANGADAVHQHMTNTRITDPEILEFRYPIRLERFEIRKRSGGKGRWNGGDGIVREIFFKQSLDVNILSQHRIVAPYGMRGGEPGKTGQQHIIQHDKKIKKLNGIDGITVNPGDRLVIKTPGGGGWGKKRDK